MNGATSVGSLGTGVSPLIDRDRKRAIGARIDSRPLAWTVIKVRSTQYGWYH